jgi:hypothetical protein
MHDRTVHFFFHWLLEKSDLAFTVQHAEQRHMAAILTAACYPRPQLRLFFNPVLSVSIVY